MPRRLCCLLLSLLIAAGAAGAAAVEQFSYRVVDKKPQERRLFIQGLEIRDGLLYVSGGNYGQSSLERFRFEDMKLQAGQRLNPRLFGEGLTVLEGRIYQLTWREHMMLVFERETLKPLEWFPIVGEGWGLTNDGRQLIYSDGSDRLYYVSPTSHAITRSLAVTEDGQPVHNLNELEWIDGEIWANIWQSDRIVIIDPDSGRVRASIDLAGLLPAAEHRPGTDVLNGIARDPADGAVWVTGKRWPWLYHIELVPAASGPDPGESR